MRPVANDITYEVRVLRRELVLFERDLESARRDVERLGAADASVDIEMQLEGFRRDATEVEAIKRRLASDVDMNVNMRQNLERDLGRLMSQIRDRKSAVTFITNAEQVSRDVAALRARILEIDRMRVEAEADVDTSRALTNLHNLERESKALSAEVIRLRAEANTQAAHVALDKLESDLANINGEVASARVDAETAIAQAQLGMVDRALVALGLKKAEVKVDVDAGAAVVELAAVGTAVDGLVNKFDTSLGREVKWITNIIHLFARQALAAAVAGLRPLGAAAVVAAAGVGALGAAFGLLLAAALPSINALSNHTTATNKLRSETASAESAQRSLADATRGVAEAHKSAAQSVADASDAYREAVAAIKDAREEATKGVADATSAYKDSLSSLRDTERQGALSVRDAESSLADARRGYADAQEEGAKQVADAIQGVADAERAEADTRRQVASQIADAYSSWRDAVAAVHDAEVQAARDVKDAYQTWQEAVRSVRDAELQAAQDVQDAYQTWKEAVRSVRDAEVQAARDVRDAYQTWREAVRSVRDAEVQAHQDIQDALEANAQAIRDLAETRKQAAEDIRSAEEAAAQASQQVADAESSLADARRAAMEATQAFADAQRDLNDAMNSEPMRQAESIIDVKQAQLDAKRIKSQLADLQRQRQEALAVGDLSEAESLEQQIAQLQLNQWQNSIDLKRAQQELNDTRKHGSDELQAARDAVEAAYRDQIQAVHAVLDGEKALVDARRAAREAERNIAEVRLDAARQIQEAERQVAETQQAIDQARLDGARSVAEAQRNAAEAYRAYLRAQIEGERSVRDAQRQALEAEKAYLQAQRDGARSIRDAQQAAREAYINYVRTQLEGQRSVRDAQESAREAYIAYVRTQRDGARQIRDAERSVAQAKLAVAEAQDEASQRIADARRQEIDAARAVHQAEAERIRSLREAKSQVAEAYAAIDEARQAGAERVADAEKSARDALENLKSAQSDAKTQIVDAMRAQQQAAEDYKTAMEDLALAQAQVGATLTASQQALLDAWIKFVADFREAFGPANDAINNLGIRILQVATSYLPRLADAALKTVNATARGFEYLVRVLDMPTVNAAINEILHFIPSITESAIRAASNLVGSLLVIIAQAMPLVQDFFKWIDKITRRFLDWLNTAEGQNAMRDFLNEIRKDAPIILDAVVKIARGFLKLADSKQARTFFREFVIFVGNLGAALPSLRFVFIVFNQLLRVLNHLPAPLRNVATSAMAMYLAFAFLGGGLFLEGLFRFIRLIFLMRLAAFVLKREGLPTLFGMIGRSLKSLLGGVGRALAILPRLVGSVLGALARAISLALQSLGRGIVSAIRAVGGGIASLARSAGEALAGIARFISTGASRIFGPIASVIGRFVTGVARALGGEGLLGVLGRVAGAIAGGSFLRVIASALLGPVGLVFLFVDATSRIIESNKHLHDAMFQIPGWTQTMVNAMTSQLFGAVKGYIQFKNSIGSILKAIGQGLVSFGKGVSQFFSKLPDWIGDAVQSIGKWVENAFQWVGASTIAGWLRGLYDNARKLFDYLKHLAIEALKAAKSYLGIHSPSREFAKIGEQIALGLAAGIRAQTKEARRAAREMAAGVEADARARAQVRLAGAMPPASASPALHAASMARHLGDGGRITRREMREMIEEMFANLPKKPVHVTLRLDGEKIGEAVIEDVNADQRIALRRGYHPT